MNSEKMTPEERKLFGEFMEIEPCARCKDPYCENNVRDYNERWDYLMQVVEKIESLGIKVIIVNNTCTIYNSQYNVDQFVRETKKQAVYDHIIDFLTWYKTT